MHVSNAIAVTPGDPDSLRHVTIEVRPPGPGEILIEVIRGGVCGTDREIMTGHLGQPPDDSDFLVLGHELIGRVREVGESVTSFAPGDLVTATVRRPDGCPLCQAGQPDMCLWKGYTEHGIVGLHGFLSQLVVVEEPWVVKLPDNLETTGVFAEPLTVVEKALRQIGHVQQRLSTWLPNTAIVFGAGPIGLLATMVLRSMDLDVYTVARTPAPNRAADAVIRTGATYVSTSDHEIEELRARLPPADIVIECTGAASISHLAYRMLGRNGAVALLSVSGGSGEISVPADALNESLVLGNGVVIGSVNAGREDWETAVHHLEVFERLWPGLTASLITTRIPFDGDISLIGKDLGADSIKTVIEFMPNAE
jgi:glucose 1-dehydrogenase